ncbi:MAG: aldo/keto reductase [Acidobacteria bacterium]|nr:aldo/keto reductase [Acidobacteriota bacterium]
MQTCTLQGSSLTLSRIGYGCMGMAGSWDATPLGDGDVARAANAVATAVDLGITLFDHADIYCRGKSEEVFGRLLADQPGLRDRVVLQSKCGIRFADDPAPGVPARYDFSRDHIVASVEASLRRLRTSHLDILLLHRPDPLWEPDEVAHAFDSLHASGKVRHFGVSNHTAAQIAALQSTIDQPIVANQVQLSLWHAALITDGIVFNRNAPAIAGVTGTLDYCREHHILVQAYSVMGKGTRLVPGGDADAADRATADLITRLAHRHVVSREAIVVAWILRHPAGIQPVLGTRTPERLRACCEADGVSLSREEWYALLTAAQGEPLP